MKYENYGHTILDLVLCIKQKHDQKILIKQLNRNDSNIKQTINIGYT